MQRSLALSLIIIAITGTVAQAEQAEQLLATQSEPYPEGKLQIRNDLFELHMFSGWFKPRCDLKEYKGSTRLLVKMTKDGRAIINPQEEENAWSSSGSFIPLAGLTFENAKMLWGEPRGMTFDLLCESHAEKDVYHLDTMFTNGQLTSYRLRGIGISKPEWTEVKVQARERPDAAHGLDD